MAQNEFKIKVLADGRLKIDTDEFGQEHHKQADEILKFLNEKLGAPESETKTKHTHGHAHVSDKLKAGQ